MNAIQLGCFGTKLLALLYPWKKRNYTCEEPVAKYEFRPTAPKCYHVTGEGYFSILWARQNGDEKGEKAGKQGEEKGRRKKEEGEEKRGKAVFI